MKSINPLYGLGLLIIISSFIVFYFEYEKESKLTPVNCIVLNYECFGRASNTTFLYNNKIYSVGGVPRELCKFGNKKDITLYYYKDGDSFYLKNSTNSFTYLYLSLFGVFILFIPFLHIKIDNYIFRKDLK